MSENNFLPVINTLYYLYPRWHCCACHGASSSSSTPPSAPCRFTWPRCWQRQDCTHRPCQQSAWWPSWTTSASSKSRWRSWRPCRLTRPNIPASSPSCSSLPVSLNEAHVSFNNLFNNNFYFSWEKNVQHTPIFNCHFTWSFPYTQTQTHKGLWVESTPVSNFTLDKELTGS